MQKLGVMSVDLTSADVAKYLVIELSDEGNQAKMTLMENALFHSEGNRVVIVVGNGQRFVATIAEVTHEEIADE